MKEKIKRKFLNTIISVAVAMSLLLPGAVAVTNNGTRTISSDLGIIWDVTLNFVEPSGMNDYVIFGEATDANDGEPPDSYDAPKPPLPMPPYLRAWFDDGLSSPYHNLWDDYRMYPDTFKVWDLYVRWKTSNATPINIDMTWDTSEFVGIEYEYITLNRYNRSTGEWD
ncbi:unnamed protein product, partial [marine sediment metagenome]